MRPNWLIGRNLGAMFPAWIFLPSVGPIPFTPHLKRGEFGGPPARARAIPSKTISHFDITLAAKRGPCSTPQAASQPICTVIIAEVRLPAGKSRLQSNVNIGLNYEFLGENL